MSRKIQHFRKKRKSRPEFLQKCKNRRTAIIHKIYLDIIPLIEYNKIRYWQKGQAQYEVFIDL